MSEDLIKRSDAIKATQRTDVIGVRLEDVCVVEYAVVEAIKALPSADRPQEWIPCKDAISRQWLINNIEKGEEVEGGVFNTDSDSVKNFINVAPSIMVEPKQGEWIDAEIPLESGGSMPIQACNLCKTFYPLAYTGGGHRFCPNCGARMKGADDE